ncbi:hypothetical protein TBR22_A51370 [Luteitalea sp. TBR-22]|uniref:CehA/McbA family metallohydrolase n=1 Tax=Luteitalea sp. TBR-22 TaxID=2802971 RepID=UPI001AFB9DBF|nr:CehA/McbA family metallohydrolase [Luteitalea sp. TBR-22]BCS35902.1 hypothetical protein TBR22_A51370 [Luteitalea sp. TBR-22]
MTSLSGSAHDSVRARAHAVLPIASGIVLAALYLYTAAAATNGTLRVTVVEAGASAPTPVRVRITDASGKPISKAPLGALAMPGEALGVPREALAIMWGHDDSAQGYATQPDGAFYVDAPFDVALPPGDYVITLTKGYEFVRQQHRLTVSAGRSRKERYELRRWIDMPGRGWYSSDDHIHLRRSPRENPLVQRWLAAEDIHVGNLLQMGDFHTNYFTQYAFGAEGRYQEGGRLISPGQEDPRTPEIGHTISLGAAERVRVRPVDAYYGYDRTFDRVHALGGITGYAHQAITFHGYRGMTLDALQRKIDFLELLQFCAPAGPLITTHYYHFLDLGFPITALAGSDFPWCGRNKAFGAEEDEGPHIGDARFYTHVDGPLTFETWMRGVKAGRTFVTTGPMLDLRVDDAWPGTTLERKDGDTLRIVVEARGHAVDVPLRDLELVVHGQVVKAVSAGEPGQSAERLRLTHDLRVGAHGLWVAARARGGPTQVAHTTPVYVRANGQGFANPATRGRYLELSEQYLREIEAALDQPGTAVNEQMSRYRAGMERRVAETRAILAQLATASR